MRGDIEWELNIVTFSWTFSYYFKFSFRSWVKLTHIMSMNTNIQNWRIIIENTSGAFPDMYIPVKNDNFFSSQSFLGNSCCYSCIVEETKSSRRVPMGVMSRRSHNCKSAVNLTITNSFGCFNRSACSHQGALSCKSVLVGVLWKLALSLFML